MTEPAVFGDPEAMRALARELAGRADIIGTIAAGFSAALDSATFEGPAAVRLRATSLTSQSSVAAAASELHGIASALIGDAATVEQMNADAVAEAKVDESGPTDTAVAPAPGTSE